MVCPAPKLKPEEAFAVGFDAADAPPKLNPAAFVVRLLLVLVDGAAPKLKPPGFAAVKPEEVVVEEACVGFAPKLKPAAD